MTKFTYHRPTQTALKSSSLLTHISQWQYKVGFTTRITLSWPSTANSYKPYDLLSYGVTTATSWKNCTGTVQRAQVTPKNGAARLKLKFSVTKLESSFWSEISLRVKIIFERVFSHNCLLQHDIVQTAKTSPHRLKLTAFVNFCFLWKIDIILYVLCID